MKWCLFALGLLVLLGCSAAEAEKSVAKPGVGASGPVALVDTWFEDFDKAKAEAKSSGRMLLVDLTATWCGPCQRLKHEVLETARFKEYSNRLVFCAIDIDAQPALAQEFGIADGIPDVRILSSDGKELGKIGGYGSPDPFYSELEKIIGG